MCYRCSLCQAVVPPKVPRLLYTRYRDVPAPGLVAVPDVLHERRTVRYEMDAGRTRREIAGEVPVCGECYEALARGVPAARLRKTRTDVSLPPEIARVVVDELPAVPRESVPQGGRKSTKRPV